MTHSAEQPGSAVPGEDPMLTGMYDVLNTMHEGGENYALYLFSQESAASAVERMQDKGFARHPLSMDQILADPDAYRGVVRFNRERHYDIFSPAQEMNEVDALQELGALFEDFVDFCSTKGDVVDKILIQRTHELRRGLYFIGENDYREGVAGLAALWRSYLAADPRTRIFVPYWPMHPSNRFRTEPEVLLQQIMRHFPEDDPMRARIQAGERVTEQPGEVYKVIILDDWVNRGHKISDLYNMFERPDSPYDVEVNLLAASERQLQRGVVIPDAHDRGSNKHFPTKAYFNAGPDVGTTSQAGPLVTGSHRVGGFEFADRVDYMARTLQQERGDEENLTPALISVNKPRFTT